MADVPRECGHGPFLRVHDGVLDDVRRAGHVLWKVALHPARGTASFGQKTPGNEAVGWGNLSENYIFSQDMVTVKEEEEEGRMDYDDVKPGLFRFMILKNLYFCFSSIRIYRF